MELSKVEQRYRAVLAVQAGSRVNEVAWQLGVSRQSVHTWLARYADAGLAGLEDRSRRPDGCSHQSSADVESAVCELRRAHPRWGTRRIEFELGRNGCPGPVPSRMTVYRILVRHELIAPAKRRRGRRDYKRWQRDEPMELWQMDIVGGVLLPDGVEAKVVTCVDDHSRYAVAAKVIRRATGRAVCTAFVEAMGRYGIPEEMLTDNGKQFTDRFGKGSEVLFDRICRENGIVHRLTQPASPTTTGKVERFHQTLRRELLDDAGVFTDLEAAQTAIDGFLHEYNTNRPHQSLDMAFPADRFTPNTDTLLPLKVPAALTQTGRQTSSAASANINQEASPGAAESVTALLIPPRLIPPRSVGRAGGIRPGGAALGQPRRRRQTVLARTGPFRCHCHLLGRHRHHPPVHRRHPDQIDPLTPVRDRSGDTGPHRRPSRRPIPTAGHHRWCTARQPSRSTAPSTPPAASPSANMQSWPPTSSPAAASASGSRTRR